MIKQKFAFLLLFISVFLPATAFSADDERRALEDLKKFQWVRLMQNVPPCPSIDCHLIWAVAPMALGDVGAYARRVAVEGVREYAVAHGITQNFALIATLEDLKPATPWHIEEQSEIKIKNDPNAKTDQARDLSVDSRILVEIRVNGIPTDVIFDSGATLTLPDGDPSAHTLDPLPLSTNNRSGLGKVEISSVVVAKDVSVGKSNIKNLIVKKKNISKSGDITTVGLFGYDLMLRFDTVNVDLRTGTIHFNYRPGDLKYCAPMELAIDNNRIPAGIVTEVLVDGVPLKARIDTGANVDVILHGKDLMPWKHFTPTHVVAMDGSGQAAALEESEAAVSLGRQATRHTILRSALAHGDFSATLGIKFFANRSFTFDFQRSRFCMD